MGQDWAKLGQNWAKLLGQNWPKDPNAIGVHGNQFHVAVYDRRGDLVSQFQCPQVNNQVFIRQCLAMGIFIRRDACFVPR